jgi:methyl-accepting chemotaxis protein
VDAVQDLTGSACTVYQRINPEGDMLAIATTFVSNDGKRATGILHPATSSAKPNPAVADVLATKTYRGRTTIADKTFLAAYEPITSPDGSVVGMLFVGVPESTAATQLGQRLNSTSAARKGEVFGLSAAPSSRGQYLFDAHRGPGRLPEGEIRTRLIENALAHPAEAVTQRYSSSTGIPMIAQLRYLAPWDWLVGVALPEQDALQSVQIAGISHRSHALIAWVFVASLLTSILLWTRQASAITSRLTVLAHRSYEDGLRIIAWSKRFASAPTENGDALAEIATLEASSERVRAIAQDSQGRTRNALTHDADAERQGTETQQHLAGMEASMRQLNTVNTKISGLMKDIDEIAFQSRILALNARIEAARAGEAGVSFAVVADQFGALAERCAGAAKTTTDFLTESGNSTRDGIEKLQSLGAAVKQMENSNGVIRSSVAEAHSAAGEQLRASSDIAQSLSTLRQMVEQGAKTSQSNSEATTQLAQVRNYLENRHQKLTKELVGKSKPAPGPELVKPASRPNQTNPAPKQNQARSIAQPTVKPPQARSQRSSAAKAPANTRSARQAC